MSQQPNILDIRVPPRAALNVNQFKVQLELFNGYCETRHCEGALASVDAMIALVQNNILVTTHLERALARALGGDITAALKDIDMVIEQQPTLVDAYIYAIRIACLYNVRKGWLYYLQGKNQVLPHGHEYDAFLRMGDTLAAMIAKQNSWKLPYDVVATIVELLSFDDRIHFAHTCTHWRDFIITCPQAWKELKLQTGTDTKWGVWLKKHLTPMHRYIRHVSVKDSNTLNNFVIHMNHLETLGKVFMYMCVRISLTQRIELGADPVNGDVWSLDVISHFFKTRRQRKMNQLKHISTSNTSHIVHASTIDILTYNPELESLKVKIGYYHSPVALDPTIIIESSATLFLRHLTILGASSYCAGLASILERSPNLESLVYITRADYSRSLNSVYACEHIANVLHKHCPRLKNLIYWREDPWCHSLMKGFRRENCLAYHDRSDHDAEEYLLDFAKRHQNTLETVVIDLKHTPPTCYFVHFLLHNTLPQLTTLCIRGRFDLSTSLNASNTRYYLSSPKVTNMIQRHSKLRHVRLEKACELEKPVLQAISQLNQLEEVALGFFHVSLVDRMDDLFTLLDTTQATLRRFHLHVGISNLTTRHIFNLVDKYEQITHLTCATDLNLMLEGITEFVRTGSSTFHPPKLSRQLTHLKLMAPTGNLEYLAFEPVCDLALLPKLKSLEITHMAGQRLSSTVMDTLVASRPELKARITAGGLLALYPST